MNLHAGPVRWIVVSMLFAASGGATVGWAQAAFNGTYAGNVVEVTKSRQPPCSPGQAIRVTVKEGVVSIPPLLLGDGQSASISASVGADGAFTGKSPGAEMRGRIAGPDLTAKIIVPRRCVYDISATRRP